MAAAVDNLQKQISSLKQQLSNVQEELRLKQEEKTYDIIDAVLDEVEENEEKYAEQQKSKANTKTKEESVEAEDYDKVDRPKKTGEFWTILTKELSDGNIDFVKNLVRNKELNMDETNTDGYTLLMLATRAGLYELVSMCINLGADIDHISTNGETALKIATNSGFLDIEELLRMNLLKTEVGTRIENTTNEILRKQGITQNFYKLLNDIFAEHKQDDDDDDNTPINIPKIRAISKQFLSTLSNAMREEVLEVILTVIRKSIENRSAYSNDMLHIAFDYEINRKHRSPTETILFKTMKNVVLDILSDTTNKKDWYWMKSYILSSSIWYIKAVPNDAKSKFLWYKMFEWVEEETQRQSMILSNDSMKKIQENNKDEWNKLILYNIETNYKYDNVRQDVIERGLKSEYTKEHIIQNVSLSATFNPLTHYDLSQYLSKLVMICHEVDDTFQFDIQRIFDVNKETKRNKKLGVIYMRGPVKKLERCYAKSQSEYRDQTFPTSARLLDIVRCSLIFEDVTSMLIGMDLLQEQIKSKQDAFCILEVVRVKNGFNDYTHDSASYTDIKFNVMIKARTNNVIGEVQFLFKKMHQYKRIAHSLYSVERRIEFVDNISKILPLKLALDKQLFIHAARNNTDGINDLMVTHSFKKEELLQLNQRNQSILTPICKVNCSKVLDYLIEMIPNRIRDKLIFPDRSGMYPLSLAIGNNHYHGVLQSIMEHDPSLANYKYQHIHIIQNCWKPNRGKCALLILKTLSPDDRLELIERDVWLQRLAICGDGETLDYVLNEIKHDTRLKDQFMNKSIHDYDGKYSNFHDFAQGGFDGGSVECIKVLLTYCENDEQRDALWNKQDNRLQLPLYKALCYGRFKIVEWMLQQMNDKQKGKFFNKPNLHGILPINQLVTENKYSSTATGGSDKDRFKTLNIAVQHLTSKYEKKLHDIFLYSAKYNQVETATIILSKTSTNKIKSEIINYRDKKTLNTALHEAAIKNNVDFVKYLLSIIEADNEQLIAQNKDQLNALMLAAKVSALRITRMILDKASTSNKQYLNTLLAMKCKDDLTIIDHAIRSKEKNNEKCAKIIMSYYNENSNINSIFLPCLQLNDIKLAQSIWNKTNEDQQLQNKLLTTKNKDGYNCFLLVAKSGNYDGLKWLLSLNDDQKNEAEQDEKNLMTKHSGSGQTPLLLCTSNDVRTQSEDTKTKDLTQEQKEGYFKCVQLMLDSVQPRNKPTLLLETDNTKTNCLMWSCRNGNLQTAQYILEECDDKTKEALIDQKHSSIATAGCFGEAISGGNMKLTQLIYDVYTLYHKETELMKEHTALRLAFSNGYIEIIRWIIFDLIDDSKKRIEFLNKCVSSTKSGRKFEENVKKMITKILENDLTNIDEEKDIENINKIFEWIMRNASNDLYCIQLILSKLKKGDDAFKKKFFEKVKCLEYACSNREQLLQELLLYLDEYYEPLLTVSTGNALISAVAARSETCVTLLFKSIKSGKIKDELIETKNVKNNALIRCVKQKNKQMIELVVSNHSSIEPILGASFRTCLFADADAANLDAAKFLLSKSTNKSLILNEKGDHDMTVLHYSLQKRTDAMLKFIVEQLEDDLKEEKDDEKDNNVHSMYLSETDSNQNIFHILLASETSMDVIRTLEGVLDKEMIRKLLLSRDNADRIPLHQIHTKLDNNIIEWTLNQFEDPLQQFKMISERNKYGDSMWKYITEKRLQQLFANILLKYLQAIDFDKIDRITLKDTFRNTLNWREPSLQSLILSKIDKSQHEFLLNPEHMINVTKSIIADVVDIDDAGIASVILSAITNEKQITLRESERGENPLLRCLAFARGYNVIKLVLKRIENKDLLFNMVMERTGGGCPLFFAYRYKDQLLDYLLSLIPDDELYAALDEAIPEDDDMNYVSALLSRIRSQDTQHKMLRQMNRRGETMFGRAAWGKKKEVCNWLMDSEMKNDEDKLFFITTPNHQVSEMPLFYLVDQMDLTQIFVKAIYKLQPKQIIDNLLHRSYTQETILSKSKNKDFQLKLAEIVQSALKEMDPITDIDTLGPLFIFCYKLIKNIQATEMVLAKSAKEIKHKLFMNHENNKHHNVLIHLLGEKDQTDMISLLLKHMDNDTKLNVLNDEANPNITRATALETVCSKGIMENFKMIQDIYDDIKVDFDIEFTNMNWKYESLLYHAVKADHLDLIAIILTKIKTDSQKMNLFNQRGKVTLTNVFDVAKSNNTKQTLKKTIAKILTNIKTNKIGYDSFISYFRWLCTDNDMESIKSLFDVFKKHKNDFLCHIFDDKQNIFHICCVKDYPDLLEFFLNNLKDDKQLLLLFDYDVVNTTPLLRASKKCLSLILDVVSTRNSKLLSQIFLESDTLITKHVTGKKKDELELIFKFCDKQILSQDLLVELLNLCGWNATIPCEETREIILSKASEIGIDRKTLLCAEDIVVGTIPLHCALIAKNDKLVDIILNDYVDLDDKKDIEYLISYRTYKQRNLLHDAGDIKSAQKIVKLCQFQKDRESLLLQKDVDGNNPLQSFVSKMQYYSSNKMNENKEGIQFYLGLIKKDDIKLQLLCGTNSVGTCVMTDLCKKLTGMTDGVKLYKELLTDIKAVDEKDIPLWAEILQSVLMNIKNEKDMMEIVNIIINKFAFNVELQKKLITYSGPRCKNVFETISSGNSVQQKRLVLIYFLKFIDNENNNILIQQNHKGICPIYNLIQPQRLDIEAQMMLHTFSSDKIVDILLIETNAHKNIIESGTPKFLSLYMPKLNDEQLMQLFMDNSNTKKLFQVLFYYVQELSDRFLSTLMNTRRKADGFTLLMVIINELSQIKNKYVWNWIFPYLKALNEEQRTKMLTETDYNGNTCLAQCGKYMIHDQYINGVLSLYPNEDLKQEAILKQNHVGDSPFFIAIQHSRWMVANTLWNTAKSDRVRLQLVNVNAAIFTSYATSVNWKKWSKELFRNMKDTYVDDVTMLLPFFYSSVAFNDIDFAKLIISKIDVNNKDKVIEFITSKITSYQECTLHFTAKYKTPEILDIVLQLIENTGYDLMKILLDERIIRNKKEETPIMIAVNNDNPQFIKQLLSKMNKKAKSTFILLEANKKLAVNRRNWNDKAVHKIHMNAIIKALGLYTPSKDMLCLEALLDNCSDTKAILNYSNNKQQTLYHYLLAKDTAQYFKKQYKITLAFKQFSSPDIDGQTPFMLITATGETRRKLQYMEWILNECCKNNGERTKLIYQYNKEGKNALDLATGQSLTLLINTLKQILASYKNVKDLNLMIPFFLYALKKGKIRLAQRLLSMVKSASDQKKLINCRNSLGVTTVLSSLKSGRIESFKWLILKQKQLFDYNLIFETDKDGLSAIHYALSSQSTVCLREIISIYQSKNKTSFDELILKTLDDKGNAPFTYFIQNSTLYTANKLLQWILNRLNHEPRLKMKMFFAKNKAEQCPMVEAWNGSNVNSLDVVSVHIHEYFSNIGSIDGDDLNIELAGYSLLFLSRFDCISVMKLIMDAIKDKDTLYKVLSVTNSDNGDILYTMVCHKKVRNFKWLLNSVIPTDHPILYSQNKHDGTTALRFLIEDGYLGFAEQLMQKISDKSIRLKLLNLKDDENESVFDYAKQRNITNAMDWIQNHINACK